MLRIASCVALAAVLAAPALADDIRPETAIRSVTVFPAGATVTRTLTADLPAGPSVLVIEDLPAEIETDSIMVDGSADGRLEIGSVATRTVPAGTVADPRRTAIEDAMRNIEDRRAAIADRIGALDGRRRFLDEMLKTVPGGFGRALGENGGGIEQWSAASKTLGEELDSVAAATRALRIEDRQLAEEVEARRKELDALPPPRDHVELRIELAAAEATAATLSIAYRTPSAGWAPTYDAQLETGDKSTEPALSIVRRAEVTQATGEDWSDVDLVLSTARPAGGTAAPYLTASIAVFQSRYGAAASGGYSQDSVAAAPAPTARAIRESAPEMPVLAVEAAADFGDFRAEYRVPGPASVVSGTGARSFRIATETASPEIEVRAVPLLSSAAYLTARFTAPEGAPLLPGKVSLFRDGAFVGTGSVPFVNAGSKVDLGFGADDRVKVVRTPVDRAVGETGILASRRTDSRRFRIKVENLHARPVRVTVLDRVPYAEDEKITIERVKDATEPTTENVDDQRGVMAWSYVYEPGETRTIENAYKVSWPAAETVVLTD